MFPSAIYRLRDIGDKFRLIAVGRVTVWRITVVVAVTVAERCAGRIGLITVVVAVIVTVRCADKIACIVSVGNVIMYSKK